VFCRLHEPLYANDRLCTNTGKRHFITIATSPTWALQLQRPGRLARSEATGAYETSVVALVAPAEDRIPENWSHDRRTPHTAGPSRREPKLASKDKCCRALIDRHGNRRDPGQLESVGQAFGGRSQGITNQRRVVLASGDGPSFAAPGSMRFVITLSFPT